MSLSGQIDLLVASMGASFKSLRSTGTTAAGTSNVVTPVGSSRVNVYSATALAAGTTLAAPSGTLADMNTLQLRLKDSGTARALTWNSIYVVATGVVLPTTTVVGKYHYIFCQYNSQTSTWDVLAVNTR